MLAPLALLLAMAAIGAIDGLYYHLWRFQLFRQPSARAETATHVLRSLSLAVVTLVLSTWEPHGAWYWALVALFVVDLADDLVDVTLEPASRAPLGGLPPREYLIHMTVMALWGGAFATFVTGGLALGSEPTALVPLGPGALPLALVVDARATAAGALLLALLEGGLLLASLRSPAPSPAQS